MSRQKLLWLLDRVPRYASLLGLLGLIGLTGVIQSQGAKRADQRIVRITRVIELAKRLIKISQVHINKGPTITRDDVCRRIQPYQPVVAS